MSGFRKPCQVLRRSGGYYDDDGIWQEGTISEELTIMASVQPMTLNIATQYSHLMPEGATTYNAVKAYSDTPLRMKKQETDSSPGQEADILLWRGRYWQVIFCEERQSDVINHYKMIAWEVGADAAGNQEVSAR